MNKKSIVKYIRVEGSKIIIIPTAEGKDLVINSIELGEQFQSIKESIEKVGNIEVFAFIFETFTPIQFWKVENFINEDRVVYYFYTVEQERIGFQLPYFVPTNKVL